MSIESSSGDWIQTYSGKLFHPLNPNLSEIDIEDIAHALSNLCRWTGHCREFYSVAQHSVFVSEKCKPENALWGLLHDASEAYIGDMNRPFKHSGIMGSYLKAEKKIMNSICDKFGMDHNMPAEVKDIDNRILQTEANQLLNATWKIAEPYDYTLRPVHPRVARVMFLDLFNKISRSLNNGSR
jgi:uncharacterized protein